MPLQATSGAASYDGFGGGVAAVPNYIEDVFNTYVWTGTGSNQTLTTNVNTSTYGGLFWTKNRTNAYDHALWPTALSLSGNYLLKSNTTGAATYGTYNTGDYVSNSTTGVTVYGNTSQNYVTWTFRKQPKFFDVVTYTGNGTLGRTVSHNLGSVPGCIIVKNTSNGTVNWAVYHRSVGNTGALYLNTTNATDTWNAYWNDTTPTSTNFTLGNSTETNANGATYVAYLFAHNAGGFGLTGTDNVISCGSYTGNGSTVGPTVTLGYEPQWVLIKEASAAGNQWVLFDNMRGMPVGSNDNYLYPNLSAAESSGYDLITPTATGFSLAQSLGIVNASGSTYIYIAIRRGPMKVPTSGTSVFIPVSATPSGATTVTTNFPVDLAINAQRDSGTSGNKVFWDRLRGSSTAAGQGIFSNLTNAEVSYSGNGIGLQSNTTIVDNFWNTLNGATTPVIYWNMRRAPSFFDEVCYTGTGTNQFINHNLGVQPDLYIVKRRSATANWVVTINASIPDTVGILNSTNAFGGSAYNNGYLVNGTVPASNFGAGFGSVNNDAANASGSTYVAYLFATCAGVSKVGSYVGDDTVGRVINCGFTSGARFVMLKKTSTTSDWYVYDTARGIVSAGESSLSLNTTAAESGSSDVIDPDSTGFAVGTGASNFFNETGVTYIYLAIA